MGLLQLVALTPTCACAPLVILAAGLQGVGSGLTAPPALSAGLSGVVPTDTGVASALTSTSRPSSARRLARRS